jgi:hypothetical protein
MTALAPASRKRPAWLLVTLLLVTIGGIALVVESVPFLMFSFMGFDAGETPEAWTFFFVVWSLPLVLLAGLALAWIGFAARAYRVVYAGFAVAALPLLAVLGFFLIV